MKKFLLSLLITIYTPNKNTQEILVFNLKEKEVLLEVTCAEGVSYSECQGLEKPPKRVESVSYEEIQNFVMRGYYSF